jgi:hypothetical protein
VTACRTSTFATPFKGEQQRKLSPINTAVLGDARTQLFCKRGDNPHSQSSALGEVKASGQSDAVVAHRHERRVLVLSGQTYPNVPIRTIRQRMFDRVGDELIDDQSQRNRSIGIELNPRRGVEIEDAAIGPTNGIRAHLL